MNLPIACLSIAIISVAPFWFMADSLKDGDELLKSIGAIGVIIGVGIKAIVDLSNK